MSDPDIHSRFAVSLLETVLSTTAGNVVVSPWSISSALAIVAEAAEGTPRKEIEDILAAELPRLAAEAMQVADSRTWDGEPILTVSNALWVDHGTTPSARFLAKQGLWPGAALRTAPLRDDPETARAAINADVAATTRGLIPEIVPPRSITPDDLAIVVNALYLLVAWAQPFMPERTVDEEFHTATGTRLVPTMRGTMTAAYAHARDGSEYVVLPMMGGLAVEIVLPEPGDGKLDSRHLAALRASATPHGVDLHLPRFRIGWTDDVVSILRNLGITQIFDREVLQIVDEEPLRIACVIHGAVLHVDEQGVEAAAATVVMTRAAGMPAALPEVEVRVDRPFLLLVTHQQTKAVLFAARVADPSS